MASIADRLRAAARLAHAVTRRARRRRSAPPPGRPSRPLRRLRRGGRDGRARGGCGRSHGVRRPEVRRGRAPARPPRSRGRHRRRSREGRRGTASGGSTSPALGPPGNPLTPRRTWQGGDPSETREARAFPWGAAGGRRSGRVQAARRGAVRVPPALQPRRATPPLRGARPGPGVREVGGGSAARLLPRPRRPTVLLLHGYDKGADPSARRQQREIAEARRRLRAFREGRRGA